jgi:hypothetical protein
VVGGFVQKYFVVFIGVVFSLISLGAFAQVASGNVAESSNPRADVLRAQNSPVHRTVEGCVTRSDNEYVLQTKHTGMVHLNGGNDLLSQRVNQRVKVLGNLASMVVSDDYQETAATLDRAMTVERVESTTGSCPLR